MGRFSLIFVTIVAFFITNSLSFADEVQPEETVSLTRHKQVISRDYMVVAAHPVAAQAGADIIAAGGNAIDAVIATQMVLNVVEPQSSGIGGGGFLLYYDKKQDKLLSYDGRETAPQAVREDMFEGRDFFEVLKSGKSVGTPGLLKMLYLAHESHGKLPWYDLLQKAINVSREGYKAYKRLNAIAGRVGIDKYSTINAKNHKFFNPSLVKTFALIAEKGIDVFYEGKLASSMVGNVQNHSKPGYLSLQDLQQYRPKVRENLCRTYRGYKICSFPAPSSGGITLLQILGIVENFALQQYGYMSDKHMHIVLEAMKIAYQDRAKYIADPDFVTVPTRQMLGKDYLHQRSKQIDLKRARYDYQPGDFITDRAIDNKYETPSTTHISIIDKQGNAASMTSSIEHAFGSTIEVEGFFLNNQLTDFNFVPYKDGKKVANSVAPGKRPRSSMTPTMVFDREGELLLVVGSPGGSRIIPFVVNAIIAVLDFGVNIQDAISQAHFLDIGYGAELEDKQLADKLRPLGHKLKLKQLNSGIHAVYIKDGIFYSGVDPRRYGAAR